MPALASLVPNPGPTWRRIHRTSRKRCPAELPLRSPRDTKVAALLAIFEGIARVARGLDRGRIVGGARPSRSRCTSRSCDMRL